MKSDYKYIPKELYPYCVPINTIKFWKENPRNNKDGAVQLSELIKVHQFSKPIIVWAQNNVTYAGNTALQSAHILKMKMIPVIYRDFESESAAIAYGISDNKAGEYSSWDDGQLMQLFKVHNFKGINVGFSQLELKALDFEIDDLLLKKSSDGVDQVNKIFKISVPVQGAHKFEEILKSFVGSLKIKDIKII